MQAKYDPILGEMVDASLGGGSSVPIPDDPVPRSNLQLEVLFDNSFADTSVNALPVTPYGTITFENTAIASNTKKARFADSYCLVPNDANLNFGTGAFAIGVWISGSANDRIIVSKMVNYDAGGNPPAQGWVMYRTPDARYGLTTWENNAASGVETTVPFASEVDTHYLMGRRANGKLFIYRNGVLHNESVTAPEIRNVNNSNNLEIGRYSWTPTSNPLWYNGDMSVLRIWSGDIDEVTALAIYQYEKP